MEYSHSLGLIKHINKENYTIRHSCDSCGGSSGAPIINMINYQVIGIHKGGGEENKNYNLGTFLKGPTEEFIKDKNENIKNNINEINNIKNEYKNENKKKIVENKNKQKLINEDMNKKEEIDKKEYNDENDEIIIK